MSPESPSPTTSHRTSQLAAVRTVVVKLGTNALSRPDDTLDTARIGRLAEQIVRIRQSGKQVVVVSSGAVGAGIGILGLKERPRDLSHLQAAASVGQAELIRTYDEAFQPHGLHASQILLTANDFRQRSRYLNVRNTLHTLFEYPVVPIINENDTVSVKEIKFGDNDRLAAMVANLFTNPLLIILSVVDGLLNGPPDSPDSRVIPLVENLDETILRYAAEVKSTRGTGGMKSKLEAVRIASSAGPVIIANGARAGILDQILSGAEVGTLFLARGSNVPAWKRWIGYGATPRGRLLLDAGAVKAVREGGRSLLAIGVTEVQGDFSKGELVSLVSAAGQEIARGLINFDAAQTRQIAGKRTADLKQILGAATYEEVIHRDNLAVL